MNADEAAAADFELRQIFLAAPVAIALTELDTGRFIASNSHFNALFGFRPEELIGRTNVELGIYETLAERQRLLRALEATGSVRDFELRLRDRAGRTVTSLYSGQVIESGGGRRLVSVFLDITERKIAEQAKSRLRQQQKLEELGKMAGGIAHDFNNILSAIIAFTELATLDSNSPAKLQEYLAEILKAGNRAKDLVRGILMFSRQHKHEMKPIRMQPVIKEVCQMVRSTLPTNIRIDCDLSEAAPVVHADATHLHQVAMNLCSNAAHAIGSDPGMLTIRLDAVELDESASQAIAAMSPGRYARLTVADTGCGMGDDTLRHIFEPFFTTKRPGEGTGLGLSVVHGIVKEHGGAVAVTSEVGRGTTFAIYLPECAAPPVPLRPAAPRFQPGTERILLVDDEAPLCEALRLFLSRIGYRVSAHTAPAEAIRVFTESSAQFDLVLTDLTMPGMSGIEVVRTIHAIRPELPVFLMSGFSGRLSDEQAAAIGIRRLLPKPVEPAAVTQAIREVFGVPAAPPRL